MISRTRNYIFVHIPKTGGTSIEHMMWSPDERTRDNLWMGFQTKFHNKYQTGGLQHLTAQQIRLEIGEDVFKQMFKFSMVRHPWDRLVSLYGYMQRATDLQSYFGLKSTDSFEIFLDRIGKREHVHTQSQWRFLCDENGELMVDHVGRFENFQASMVAISRRAGLAFKAEEIPFLNKSQRGVYTDYYTDETREWVGEIYRKDIELFDYSYDSSRAT